MWVNLLSNLLAAAIIWLIAQGSGAVQKNPTLTAVAYSVVLVAACLMFFFFASEAIKRSKLFLIVIGFVALVALEAFLASVDLPLVPLLAMDIISLVSAFILISSGVWFVQTVTAARSTRKKIVVTLTIGTLLTALFGLFLTLV